jgi:hypothetical protein
VAKKKKPCDAPSAPGITTDRTIDERGTQRYHAIKLDNYEKRTTVVQSQQIYQEAAIVGIKNEKPKTAAVTAVMSFYNKRLVIKARLLDDPTPIIDTAESVPPNVRSASHFLPQREYIGRAGDRPKINQVVLVRVPPNGSYEVPGTIVEITDEITGPPIRVPKKKKDKSKGAKAAAKGQPAGGIPESPIPGDSTGKKVNPQNQIPKPVDAPPPPPGRRPGGKFEVIQEAAPTPLPSRPKESYLSLEQIQFALEHEAKGREEKAKKEREEATRKAKEDAKKAEDIAKGKEQAPVEEVKEIETEGDQPPAPPVTLTQEERARVKEINIPPYYDEENNSFVAFAKTQGPALTGGTLEESIKRAEGLAFLVMEEFLAASGYNFTAAALEAYKRYGLSPLGTLDVTYIPDIPRVTLENVDTRGDYVKVVVAKVSISTAGYIIAKQ